MRKEQFANVVVETLVEQSDLKEEAPNALTPAGFPLLHDVEKNSPSGANKLFELKNLSCYCKWKMRPDKLNKEKRPDYSRFKISRLIISAWKKILSPHFSPLP